MPLRAIHNLRSLVALENLVDFIIVCSDRENSPMAANQVFLISDDDDISTPELLTKLAAAYEVKIRLIFVPLWMMRFVAFLFRRTPIIDRLSGSLQVDCSKAKTLVGWKPVISMDEQLRLIAVNQT